VIFKSPFPQKGRRSLGEISRFVVGRNSKRNIGDNNASFAYFISLLCVYVADVHLLPRPFRYVPSSDMNRMSTELANSVL